MMNIAKVMGTASLLMLFGVAAPSHAQEPQDTPKEQPKDKEQPKEKAKEQPKNPKDQPDKPKEQPRPENRNDAAARDEHAKQEQGHGQAQRGRIPDDKFKASFGREHTFHVGHPEIVGGQPHFSYGGYSFVIGQPWPAGWAYSDNVYIVDIDGVYYLVDLDHPGPQVALTIVL
jgi:hypothetical protein